ncbi:MAG: hypothetical protein ACI8ZM_001931 [Crocinitomix sp.]|jgi:hypothetical protein
MKTLLSVSCYLLFAIQLFSQDTQTLTNSQGVDIIMTAPLEFKGAYDHNAFVDSKGRVYKTAMSFNEIAVQVYAPDLSPLSSHKVSISEADFPEGIWYKYFRTLEFIQFSDQIGLSITIRNTKSNIKSKFIRFFDDDFKSISESWEFISAQSSNSVRARHNMPNSKLGDRDAGIKRFLIHDDQEIFSLYGIVEGDAVVYKAIWYDQESNLFYSDIVDFGSGENGEAIHNVFFMGDEGIGCFTSNALGQNFLRTINRDGVLDKKEITIDKLYTMDVSQKSDTEFFITGINEEFHFQSYYYSLDGVSTEITKGKFSNNFVGDLAVKVKDDRLLIILNLWDGGFKAGWKKEGNTQIAALFFDISSNEPKLLKERKLPKGDNLEYDGRGVALQKESKFLPIDFYGSRAFFVLKSYNDIIERAELPYGKFSYLAYENGSGMSSNKFVFDLNTGKLAKSELQENEDEVTDLIEKLVTSRFYISRSTNEDADKKTKGLFLIGDNFEFNVKRLLYDLPAIKKISKYKFKYVGKYLNPSGETYVYFSAISAPDGYYFRFPI